MVPIIITLVLLGFGTMFFAMHSWINNRFSYTISIAIGALGFILGITGIILSDMRKAEYREVLQDCMLLQIQQEGMDAETAEFVCEEELTR